MWTCWFQVRKLSDAMRQVDFAHFAFTLCFVRRRSAHKSDLTHGRTSFSGMREQRSLSRARRGKR